MCQSLTVGLFYGTIHTRRKKQEDILELGKDNKQNQIVDSNQSIIESVEDVKSGGEGCESYPFITKNERIPKKPKRFKGRITQCGG